MDLDLLVFESWIYNFFGCSLLALDVHGRTNIPLYTLTTMENALGTQLSRMLADETMSKSFLVVMVMIKSYEWAYKRWTLSLCIDSKSMRLLFRIVI